MLGKQWSAGSILYVSLLSVPRPSQCGNFKLNSVSWERSPIIWFTDWLLEGCYLEDVSWTLLQFLPLSSPLKGSKLRQPWTVSEWHWGTVVSTDLCLTSKNRVCSVPKELALQGLNPQCFTSIPKLGLMQETGGETAVVDWGAIISFVWKELEGFSGLKYYFALPKYSFTHITSLFQRTAV